MIIKKLNECWTEFEHELWCLKSKIKIMMIICASNRRYQVVEVLVNDDCDHLCLKTFFYQRQHIYDCLKRTKLNMARFFILVKRPTGQSDLIFEIKARRFYKHSTSRSKLWNNLKNKVNKVIYNNGYIF